MSEDQNVPASTPAPEQVSMPNIIDLKNIKEGDTVHGVVLFDTYAIVPYGTGKKKIDGTMSANGVPRKFIVWPGVTFDRLCDLGAVGRVVEITATVDSYNNDLQLKVTAVTFQHAQMDPLLLMRSIDIKAVRTQLSTFMRDNLAEDCVRIFNDLLKQEDIVKPFFVSAAALKMHDAQVGGLMNHTLKMLRLAKAVLENDSRLEPEKDLIYLGILLHDVGKTKEMTQQAYTEFSFVTHRVIAVDMLSRVKDQIVAARGEGFYWHLVAILVGHHGDFEDPCRTVWTKVVHLIDMLDSQTTMILDRRELSTVSVGPEGTYIWDNGKKLVY